jgi:HSP20 family protein
MVRNALTPWTRGGLGVEPAIDRFFARTFDVPVWSGGADVEELDDRAVIRLDVPGVKPDQITISAEHRTLTVKVEREGHGTFSRQYTIGPKYDLGGVQAALDLGVLTLSLPKAPEAQPRQIPVQVG